MPGGLRPFADCAEFTTHMRGLAAAEAERMVHRLHVDAYAPYGYQDGLGGPMGLQTEPMPDHLYPPGPAKASDPGAQPPEPGAQRPDEVAVAGTHVLTLTTRGPALRVVDVAGGVPRLVARMRLPYPGRELLLLDDRRVLVVAAFDAAWPGLPAPWRTPQTALMLVDLADPGRPVLTRTQKITGQYVSGAPARRGTAARRRQPDPAAGVAPVRARPAGAGRGAGPGRRGAGQHPHTAADASGPRRPGPPGRLPTGCTSRRSTSARG